MRPHPTGDPAGFDLEELETIASASAALTTSTQPGAAVCPGQELRNLETAAIDLNAFVMEHGFDPLRHDMEFRQLETIVRNLNNVFEAVRGRRAA